MAFKSNLAYLFYQLLLLLTVSYTADNNEQQIILPLRCHSN